LSIFYHYKEKQHNCKGVKQMNFYPNTLRPVKIGEISLKNRLQFLPQVCCLSTTEGEANDEMVAFVGEQARTGVGLITIGDTQINHERCDCFYGEMNVTHDRFLPGMHQVADEAHKYGAKISIELSHSGRGASQSMIIKPAYAPSDIPIGLPCAEHVIVMGQKEMDEVVGQFVDCAVRCKTAGFDMIMLHSAHQNLLGQFLSPYSNKRTDEYGGSLENRMRFPLRIIKALREALGADFPIEMRVSSAEEIEGGYDVDETIAYLRQAQKYINMVQVSRGSIFHPQVVRYCMPGYLEPDCLNVELAGKIKAAIDIPVSVAGNISTMDEAEKIISEGKADIVGMGRAFIADPQIINKSAHGEKDRVRPCLHCHDGCALAWWGYPVRCAVNPEFGQPIRFRNMLPAVQKKKVMIIGGGPAGMTAAQTASKRGHEVVLYEKSDCLGGMLIDAGAIAIKKRIAQYTKWMVRETMECGARIELGKEADINVIKKEAPDVLFITVGAHYFVPPIKGAELKNVVMASDVDHKKVETGNKVVVCGGGAVGCESALQLAMDGKEVTIVDMIPEEQFASTVHPLQNGSLMIHLQQYGVAKMGNCKIQEFIKEGVVVEDKDGNHKTVSADTIVLALGVKPNDQLNSLMYEDIAKEVYVCGDCEHIGNIRLANANAFNYAVQI
jgi:2,4-dienoyl-CoA reductase-like NADH-dependent reductase (Old Yellow Enzyme family)/thioredoxin reductase